MSEYPKKMVKDGVVFTVSSGVQEAAFVKSGWEPVDSLDRDALKLRAAELGLEYPSNISTDRLAEMVAAAEAR